MGLDMYLTRKRYVKNWDHMKPEEKHFVSVLKNGKPVEGLKSERISEVVEDVGYWRKANAIHRWFVQNVQDGEDDCGTYYVSREKLKELKLLCEKVVEASKLVDGKINNGSKMGKNGWEPIQESGQYIADSSVAAALLPTQEGFFFGGKGYDQYYIDDLKETAKMIQELLLEPEEGDIYYHSSW